MKKRPHSIPHTVQAIMTFTEQPFVSACDQACIAFMIIQSDVCTAAERKPEIAGFSDTLIY